MSAYGQWMKGFGLLGTFLCIIGSFSCKATDDISYHLQAHEFELLDVNFKDNTLSIPVMWFPSAQALSKGFVLIMVDADAQGVTQKKLYQMAKELPKWGWQTLYVRPSSAYLRPLPISQDAPQAPIDQQSVGTDNADDASSINDATAQNEENVAIIAQQTELKPFELQGPELGYSLDDYEEFSQILWQQIQARFMAQPGYKVLVAQGKSAAVALRLLQGNEDSARFNALVTSNMHWPQAETNRQLSILLSKLRIPVLDLTSNLDNHWAQKTAPQRLIDTRVALKTGYRQRNLQGTLYSALQEEYLSKEFVGFTHYLGW